MMDTNYQNYHKQALDLQYHFHDIVDNHSHPQVQSLEREIHGLVSDIESNRHPRTAEDRIKVIEHQLLQARTSGEVLMSYQDADSMRSRYEHMREEFRKLPNY